MEEPEFPEASLLLTLFVGGIIALLTVLPFPTGAVSFDFMRMQVPYVVTCFAFLTLPSAFLDPRGVHWVSILTLLLCLLIEIFHHVMNADASPEHFLASILGSCLGIALGRLFRWAFLTRNL